MIKSVHAFLSNFKADLISHAFLGFLLHLRFEEKIILKQYNVAAHRQWIKYVSLTFFFIHLGLNLKVLICWSFSLFSFGQIQGLGCGAVRISRDGSTFGW